MSDVDTSQSQPGVETPNTQPDGASTKPVDDLTELKAEIKRKEDLLKKTQAKLAKFESESKQAQEAAMAEQGKFKELADKRQAELEAARAEISTYADRIKAIEIAQQNELDDILKTLSDTDKDIVGKTAQSVESQLLLARHFAAKKPTPPDPNFPGKGGTQSNEIKYPSMKGLK